MTTEKAIRMIDEYLAEPNSIHRDWIEVLILCRQALADNGRQKAELKLQAKQVVNLKIKDKEQRTEIERLHKLQLLTEKGGAE